jgi:hypothetical protein
LYAFQLQLIVAKGKGASMKPSIGLACILATGAFLATAPSAFAQYCAPAVCANPFLNPPPGFSVQRGGFTNVVSAKTYCKRDPVVWKEGRAPIYHLKGSPKFGKTASGAYLCRQGAMRIGAQPAKAGRR